MKKNVLFFVALALLSACGTPSLDVVEYNDAIVDICNVVNTKMQSVSEAFAGEDLLKADDLRKETIADCDMAIAEIKALGAFEGSNDFPQAALNYVQGLRQLNQNEMKEMLDIMFRQTTVEDFEELEKLSDQLTEVSNTLVQKGEGITTNFNNAQKQFARKHNMQIGNGSYQSDEY